MLVLMFYYNRPQQVVTKRTPVGLTVSKRYSTGSIPVKGNNVTV